MSLCDTDQLHVKLQVYVRNVGSESWPTRVVIRVMTTDLAEVCLDERSGTCWMGLLTTPVRKSYECYKTLEYVINCFGILSRPVLGHIQDFRHLTARRLLSNLPPQSTLCLCKTGRLLGWPCVMSTADNCSLKVYFSHADSIGRVIDHKHLRCLVCTTPRVGCDKHAPDISHSSEKCSVCHRSTHVAEWDSNKLPSTLGPGFQSIMLPRPDKSCSCVY